MADQSPVTRTSERRRRPRRAWDRGLSYGKKIGAVIVGLVIAVPQVYDVLIARGEERKLHEMINANREHQLRILEKQIEELKRKEVKP